MRARPSVFCTHTTVCSSLRRWAINAGVTSDRFHGSSRPRSTTSTMGHPLRSSSIDGRRSRPPTASSPLTVGHGETSSTGTPARRPRSTATSRACHVGLRSSCRASSCSSTTTTAARSRHGAHAAARAPMTTSTPAAACAHSCGTSATARPARRSRVRVDPGAVDGRHDHEHGPESRRCRQHGQDVLGRWEPQHAATSDEQISRIPVRRLDGDLGSPLGWQGTDIGRRAGGDEERTQAPSRPADRCPARQFDQRGVRTARAELGDRPQLGGRRVARVQLDDPAAHAPPVQRDSQQRPHLHRGGHLVRDEVVELLVQPGQVGQDTCDGRTCDGQCPLAGGAGGGGSCRSPLPVDRSGLPGRSTAFFVPAAGWVHELDEQPLVAKRNVTD